MANSLDFHKLQDESTGYLYAVLNLNNMIPVPDNCLTQLKYNQVESFRSFSNEKEKTDYVYLLQKEKALIDNVQDTLQNKALKLYQKCIAKPDSSLAARCCNFKMLEEKCSSFYDGISSVIVWSRKSSRIISSHLRYFFILRACLS